MWIFCLHVFMHLLVPGAHKSQKQVLDPWGVEMQTVGAAVWVLGVVRGDSSHLFSPTATCLVSGSPRSSPKLI